MRIALNQLKEHENNCFKVNRTVLLFLSTWSQFRIDDNVLIFYLPKPTRYELRGLHTAKQGDADCIRSICRENTQ